MQFIALDVETANPDMSSICQIGIVRFSNGVIVEEWSQLIDPNDRFDEVNVGIHGITSQHVAGKPKLVEVQHVIRKFLEGSVTVCHTHFDRVSLERALQVNQIEPIHTKWLDSARVARRAWHECASSGYGLAALSKKLGFEFNHHDALEDATAAGLVLLSAMKETGLNLDEWLRRVLQPTYLAGNPKDIKRSGNPDGELFGEVIVFTGMLSFGRQFAADIASKAGCFVSDSVTKKTSILVVGDQDVKALAGHTKSSKHRKAEELILKGQPIRIVTESDFLALIGERDNLTH